MKKSTFLAVSLFVTLTSCFLFAGSTMELFSDMDYIRSLQLPSDGDSTMIAIGTGVLGSLFMMLVYLIFHPVVMFILKKKQQNMLDLNVLIGKKHSIATNILLGILYVVAFGWIKDYVGCVSVKFFTLSTLFLIFAESATYVFAVWMVNILKSKKLTTIIYQ